MRILFSLLLAVFLCLVSSPIAIAQGQAGPSARVTFANEATLRLRSNAHQFPAVDVSAGEMVGVALKFSTDFAGTPIHFDVLDGSDALLSGQSATIDENGRASFQFQAPTKSGLYRVLVSAGSSESMVQLSVGAH